MMCSGLSNSFFDQKIFILGKKHITNHTPFKHENTASHAAVLETFAVLTDAITIGVKMHLTYIVGIKTHAVLSLKAST